MCVTVCPPDSKIRYSVLCVLMFMYYTVSYFIGIFHAVVRQISMLLIDNKDSVLFCPVLMLVDRASDERHSSKLIQM